ncbi:phosphoribosylformylglycinamidine synthase subunit PurQ [Mangrovicoccus ximenensis]|uniref:phosphoribosylformylglycinamidine synthase subunit PurQ n=1 Tax=Mangrovicoccus ximenensis TaxID=1911570 RepID=UPI000D3C6114|nr:phosphoribosylformylglycinamidine synthase subunit PurQ [Mangrovicoccus ximenensis]
MRAAVIVFPGSNCDRDMAVAFREVTGAETTMVWHGESGLPDNVDIVGIPGGFSFGDYLRCGAIAANSPICRAVVDFAKAGGAVLGVCNGFQVLTETGLLPGALMRNSNLKFVCKPVDLVVETADSIFTSGYEKGQKIEIPVAHHDGSYRAAGDLMARLKDEDRIAFRYAEDINGADDRIAGVLSSNRRVLGLMPHPERAVDALHGGTDGVAMFKALAESLVSA